MALRYPAHVHAVLPANGREHMQFEQVHKGEQTRVAVGRLYDRLREPAGAA